MRPTVGRIVHFVSRGSADGVYEPKHRAAIVTDIYAAIPEVVDLCVLNPEGMYFTKQVPQDETTSESGTWHWPEREE